MYSRLGRPDALKHPRRRLILEYVERNPGARFHQIKNDLSLPHGVLVHHLRVLRRHGLLLEELKTRQRRFRTPGQRPEQALQPEACELLELVRKQPGLTMREAAIELGWTRRKTGYWIGHLEARQRVARQAEGTRRRLVPVIRAGDALPN